MSEIIKGLANLVQSFFQIIYGTISTVVSTIVGTVEAAFRFVIGLFQSVFNVSEGIVGLIIGTLHSLQSTHSPWIALARSVANKRAGNLTLILTAGALYWGYIIYQQRQGNRNPQPLKELSGKVKQATQ